MPAAIGGNSSVPPAPQGAQGPAGLGITSQGTYSSLTTYSKNDLVVYNGSSYISIVNNNLNNQPDISSGQWTLVASQGPTGPVSTVPGPTGPTGPTGPLATGPTGPTGPIGPTGQKAAILYLKNQWRALLCIEAPESRFEDVMEVEIQSESGHCVVKIDNLFVDACEPNTIKLRSMHCDQIGLGYSVAKVLNGCEIDFSADKIVAKNIGRSPLTIRFGLTGIRRGFTDRFPIFTQAQAEKNTRFWNEATKA